MFERCQAIFQFADLQQFCRDLGEVGERAITRDTVLEAEGVEDGYLDQPADRGDGAEPLEVIGARNHPFAPAALSAQSTGLSGFLSMLR